MMFDIDIKDLLGRRQVMMDMHDVAKMIRGKSVCVTGAGGFIGSEIVRQVEAFEPHHITLVDFSEFNLYSIDRKTRVSHSTVLADVRDRERMMDVIRGDIVFHAAALKHVPLSEANPIEAIRTNTVGTANVSDAAQRNGVTRMVMVSTDKAVNPTNIMGASKRAAERYCIGQPGVCVVRFGNVLGSTGSVVPLFLDQIANGGPVTITHPDVERYFMSGTEAVELVLKSAADGADGVYALDMGKSVRIMDLARDMILLSGKRGVEIEVVGLRPGEKLYEEVCYGHEDFFPTRVEGLWFASPSVVDPGLSSDWVADLEDACLSYDVEAVGKVRRA